MLWCKYKPHNLDDFGYNHSIVTKLKTLVKNNKVNENILNMVFYGDKSSGKLTLCRCLLSSIFGENIHDIQEEIFTTKQNCTPYNVKIVYSKHHYEISFCGLQFADKAVLISILDKYFSTMSITTLTYKILVIKDFDILSEPAQFALRRRIETNYTSVRFILLVKSLNKIEKALLSRLLTIRCRKPYDDEIITFIKKVCTKENITISNEKQIEITQKSSNCISKILFYLEQIRYVPNSEILCPEDLIINDLLSCLKNEIYLGKEIRDHISKLLLGKIDQNKIFHKILKFSIDFLDNNSQLHYSICEAARLENISQKSNKFIICVETYLHTIYCLKYKIILPS